MAMQSSFATSLFEHKAWCNRALVGAIAAAPADVDRRRMAVILLTLDHTWRVDQIFRSRLLGEEVGVSSIVSSEVPSLDELGARLAKTDAWYVAYAGSVPAEALEEAVSFVFVSDGETGSMTRGQMLAHVITHGASHRAEIHRQMKALGLEGAPDGMVTSFLSKG